MSPQHPESLPFQYRTIYDLSGGMVTDYNFYKYKSNESLRLLNGNLTTDGAAEKRRGREKLNSVALSSNGTVLSLDTIGQTSGADLIMAGSGTVLNEVSTGTNVLVRSGLTEGNYLASSMIDNFRFYCNGVDTPFMTQGALADTFDIGIAGVTVPQQAGFTVGPGPFPNGNATVGSHRATFRYRSTTTGARSNPNIVSGVISSVTIVIPADPNDGYEFVIAAAAVSADAQVGFIDIFVQEAGANINAPYYFLGSVANTAATVTFATNVSDDELIVQERLDIDDNQPVTTMRDIETWRGRLLGITGDFNVAFSKQRVDENGFINLPTSFPATNSLDVGFGDGDPLVKIIKFNDFIFAFKRKSIWLLIGDFGTANFGFRRLKTNHTNIGLLNVRSIVQAGDRIFFITDDLKFYFFFITSFSSQELRLKEIPSSDPVSSEFTTFASAFRENVNLINFTFSEFTQIWASFSDGSSGLDASQNFNVFVYDYTVNETRGAWHIHTGHEVASSVLARDSNRNYFVFSGDYFGFVWKHTEANGDGGSINGTSTGSNYNQLVHGAVTNAPFVVGETITGGTSAATGTVTFVDGGGTFVRVNPVNGTFVDAEVITGGTSTAFATITSSFGVLNDTNQSYTSTLIGVFTTILNNTGEDQIRRITAVPSGTQIQLEPLWGVVPDNTSTYTVGGINFQLWSRNDWLDDAAPPDFDKYIWYLDTDIETEGDYGVEVLFLRNRILSLSEATQRTIATGGSFWGTAIWLTDVWSETVKQFAQIGLDIFCKQISHRIINRNAGQWVRVNGWTYTYQQQQHIRLN